MPLGTIPPWLNIGPTDYLHAIQAGTQAGLEVNRMRAVAEEAAARRMQAQQDAQRAAWEFGENLRQKAALAQQSNERQREYDLGMLAWHQEQLRRDREKMGIEDERERLQAAETMRHNLATEAFNQAKNERDVTPTEVDLDPSKYYVTAGGAVVPPRREAGLVTPNSAFNAVTDLSRSIMAQQLFGPEYTNLVNIARSGFIPKPPQGGTLSTNAPSLSLKPLDRQTAMDLLKQSGGDKEKARQMARELGYTF